LGQRSEDLVKIINHNVAVYCKPVRQTILEHQMTSISAASSSSAYQTPLQKLQDELQAEITAGKVSTSDQDALSSALTDIDSSLQSSRSSDSTSGTKPSGDLKSKIDDLISGEVSSGKLTADQATELQNVFKTAFADAPGGAGGAKGHHGGHHGPPPTDDGSSTTDSTSTDSTGTSTNSVADIMQQFLKSLQDSLSASSSTATYSATGTSGTTASGSSFSALLIDYQT
jgi:hypothetical protein